MNVSIFRSTLKLNVLFGLGLLSTLMLTQPAAASAKEVCVRASNGNVVCGQLVPKPTNLPSKSNPVTNPITGEKVEQDGFSFQSQGCKRNTQGVICNIVVNNLQDSTRTIRVHGISYGDARSRAVEPNGETSFAAVAFVGSNQNVAYVDVILNPNLPTKVSLKFLETSKNAATLSALALTYFDVQGNSVNGEKQTSILRNISIR
jgi:hypothetical protein